MKNILFLATVSTVALVASNVQSQEQSFFGWNGHVEGGINIQNGNTNSENLTVAAALKKEVNQWVYKLGAKGQSKREEGVRTAEKYSVTGEADYKLNEDSYAFADAEYAVDTFSGYNSRITETVGYGRKLVNKENYKVDVKASIGGRHTDFSTTTTAKENEAVFKPSAHVEWQINDNVTFNQELFSTIGQEVIVSKSVTALKSKLSEKFYFKTSLDIDHQSEVAAGVKKTDIATKFGVVYEF